MLNELGLPLGVVTSINGGVRFAGEVRGMASHAGTTPMTSRRDAAAAVAELAVFLEKRAQRAPNLVGTMGMLEVPNGSTNVVPGRCKFTLDIRATTNPVRDACVDDVLGELEAICDRRGLSFFLEETMRVAASPSAPDWQARWERAVVALGLPVHRMPSGAGHDAMKIGEVMAQAMLFVRGENAGISHNPLESSTADDMQLAVEAFLQLLDGLAAEERAAHERARRDDDARLDAWIDAHFDDEVRFLQALVRVPTDTPPGDNAPHAEATATLLEGFGFAVERHPVPDDARARARPRIDHQPGRSPPLRRRADDRPQRPRRRRPAGRRLAPRSVRRRGRRRQALRPRRRGEQERLRDLHLRRARARIARRALAGGVELHFTYDEEFGGELGPGRLLAQRRRQARPADRRRLQLPGRHRAQRLPAARGRRCTARWRTRRFRRPASTRCRARSRS